MDTALEPLPPLPVAAVGSLRELMRAAADIIDTRNVPVGLINMHPEVDGPGFRCSVYCPDGEAMCAALGVAPDWRTTEDGTFRYLRVIIDGIEFHAGQENA